MPKIAINILVHERVQFLNMTVWSLSRIRNKENVVINLLCSGIPQRVPEIGDQLRSYGFEVNVLGFARPAPYNFMDKISWMTDESQPEYLIRVDDDCFAPPLVWETLIGLPRLLEDEEVMAVAPCVTNGLPTVDDFRETFLDPDERDELDQIILANPILNKWTIDFSSLAPAFEEKEWNPDLYYKLLYEHGDDRLGVHPVRFSLDAQQWIAQKVFEHWERFMNPPCVTCEYVRPDTRPYYCNTCFLIKREKYREIITDESLKRDAFEELPFNLYRRKHNKELGFITDAWMMNFCFRSVGNLNIEKEMYKKLMTKLEKS
jgi:hypothetical protein